MIAGRSSDEGLSGRGCCGVRLGKRREKPGVVSVEVGRVPGLSRDSKHVD